MYFEHEEWVDESDGEWIDFDVYVSVDDVYNAMSSFEENEMRKILGTPFVVGTLEDEQKLKILKELFESKNLKEIEDIINNK